jgi:chemotaxis protein CheX
LELAAREVFQMMVGSDLDACATEDSNFGDITAMIGLAGELCGLVTVNCNAACAEHIASAMLGANVTVDDGALDALGEICNMVAGNFKAKVTHLANGCVLSVPTVIRGSDYELHPIGDGSSMAIRQSFKGCPLQIALRIHQ